jgi:hypothetical protein
LACHWAIEIGGTSVVDESSLLAIKKMVQVTIKDGQEKPENLSDRLSVVITTSAVPDNPSTLMLSKVLDSFQSHLSPNLHQVHLILMCDGAKPFAKSEPKSGRVTEPELENYDVFKERAKELLLDWSFGDLGNGIENRAKTVEKVERVVPYKASRWDTVQMQVTDFFIGLKSNENLKSDKCRRPRVTIAQVPSGTPRLGFGLSIEFSLRFLVQTPLALIAQHDWAFSKPVPLENLLDLLQDGENRVKYIGFLSSSTVGYEERRAIPQGFPSSWLSNVDQTKLFSNNPKNLTLQRLYFWYDRTHLARVTEYLSLVFPNTRPVSDDDMKERHVKRGDFIEDTFGHAMMSDLRSLMVEGAENDPIIRADVENKVIERHRKKYGCYLWYPQHSFKEEGVKKTKKDKDRITLRHLHGRKFHKRSEVMLQAYLEEKAEQVRLRREKGVMSDDELDDKSEDSWKEESSEDIFNSSLFDS